MGLANDPCLDYLSQPVYGATDRGEGHVETAASLDQARHRLGIHLRRRRLINPAQVKGGRGESQAGLLRGHEDDAAAVGEGDGVVLEAAHRMKGAVRHEDPMRNHIEDLRLDDDRLPEGVADHASLYRRRRHIQIRVHTEAATDRLVSGCHRLP
jgi:hypothetical protein